MITKHLLGCESVGFRELNIKTHKQVKNFEGHNVSYCVVTYDNKFLIISPAVKNIIIIKWLIQTKQQLHSWDGNVDQYVKS